jgi:putative MATE family efflux protein
MARRSASDLRLHLVEGPITPSLLRLAWPIMLSSLLQTVYNFVDRLWLAKLSPIGIAALALCWPLIFLVLSIGLGITIAGTALVAQYTGARRADEANLAAGQVIAFAGAVSVVLAAAGFFAARPILSLMGAETNVMVASATYLRIIYAGIPLMFGTFTITALLSGVGDTVTPMWLMFGSVVLNLGLDPLFIFGIGPFPRWEVAGAAAATLMSRAALLVVGFYLLFSGRVGVHVRRAQLRPHWGLVRRIVSIGGLASIGQAGTAIGFAIMNSALARIGTAVLGAFGIGNAFISIVLMPSMGLGQATATFVGQNLGAEKPDRARQSAWAGIRLSTTLLCITAVFVYLFRADLIRFFLSDPDVVQAGSDMLRLTAFAFPFMGIIQVVMGVYQGAGHTLYSMFFGLFRLWALRVPLVYVLSFSLAMGAQGVWWAMLVSNFVTAGVSLGFFLSGNWTARVIHKRRSPLQSESEASTLSRNDV